MKALLKLIRERKDAITLLKITEKNKREVIHKKHSQKLDKDIINAGGFSVNFGGYGSYSSLGTGKSFHTKWEIPQINPKDKSFSGVLVHIKEDISEELTQNIRKYIEKFGGKITTLNKCDLLIAKEQDYKEGVISITPNELITIFPSISPKKATTTNKIPKELKEVLKKLQTRDINTIDEAIKSLEVNPEHIEDLLASVSVNKSTGEIERGPNFKGTKPALAYLDIALFKLLSISNDSSLGGKIRKSIKKIETFVEEIPTLKGFDNLESLVIYITNMSGMSGKDLSNFGDFKNLKSITINLDKKPREEHRSWDKKPYLTSLNGLSAPILEDADFKNIGLSDISSISNSTKIKRLYLSENIELSNVDVLEKCISIEELELRETAIESIKSLSLMKKLKRLSLEKCNSLKDLKGIESLKDVLLYSAYDYEKDYKSDQICTLEYLESLRNIESLPLLEEFTKCLKLNGLENITSLKGIEKCKKLERIVIKTCNKLKDISSLSKLKSLISVEISYAEKLDDFKVLGQIQCLKVCSIDIGRDHPDKSGSGANPGSSEKVNNMELPNCWPESLSKLRLSKTTAKRFGKLPKGLEQLGLGSNLYLETLEGIENCQEINTEENIKNDYFVGYADGLDLSKCFALKNLNGLEKILHLKRISISPLIENLDSISTFKDLTIVLNFKDAEGVSIPNQIPKRLAEELSKLKPYNLVIDGYRLDNISNLATSTNIRSLDMDYVQVNDLSAISTMENLEYIKIASGSELVKDLKKRVFDTEGQIAKLKMKLLTTI